MFALRRSVQALNAHNVLALQSRAATTTTTSRVSTSAKRRSPTTTNKKSDNAKPQSNDRQIMRLVPQEFDDYTPKEFLKEETSAGPVPKRPLTSFAAFLRDISTKQSGASREGLKSLSQKFNTLDAFEKKKLDDIVEKDKARYAKEYSEWSARLTKKDKELMKWQDFVRAKLKGKRPTHPDKPKQPLNAYMLWTKENRSKYKNDVSFSNLSNTQFIAKLGAVWKLLPDNEKKKFQDKATKLREEYKKEMAE